MSDSTYVLLTAAHNEEEFIEKTIKSVIRQSVTPRKWLIISDASTDRTDEIVLAYSGQCDFIGLERSERDRSERDFRFKVEALNLGYRRMRAFDFHYVGILDADVVLDVTYYEEILSRFKESPKLGIAGGIPLDCYKGKTVMQSISVEWSVPGPIQMFRRECFEAIGGYRPVPGGEDAVAEHMARMAGWEVRTFPDIRVFHLRPVGTAMASSYGRYFRQGVQDYQLGYHPVFFFLRSVRRAARQPYLIGGVLMFFGFLWSVIRRSKRHVDRGFVHSLRREQIGRLRFLLAGRSRRH